MFDSFSKTLIKVTLRAVRPPKAVWTFSKRGASCRETSFGGLDIFKKWHFAPWSHVLWSRKFQKVVPRAEFSPKMTTIRYTMVIISWKLKELWKNRFFDLQNPSFQISPPSQMFQKTLLFHQFFFFFSKTVRVDLKSYGGWNNAPDPVTIRW